MTRSINKTARFCMAAQIRELGRASVRLGMWNEAASLQAEYLRLIKTMRDRLKSIFSVAVEVGWGLGIAGSGADQGSQMPETLEEQTQRMSLVPVPPPPTVLLEAPTLGADDEYRVIDILSSR